MISIVIPSLLGYKELNEQCIESYVETSAPGDKIEFLLIEKNRSFALNVNEGLKKAQGDHILISNNDVKALPNWSRWIQSVPDNRIATLAPTAQCGWGYSFHQNLLDKIGMMDETLVNSYEDYDFYIRAALEGIGRIMAHRIYAIHEGGVTLNKIWGQFEMRSSERMNQCNANRAYMLKKWPGLNIDAVPTPYWVVNGFKIMAEWVKTNRVRA